MTDFTVLVVAGVVIPALLVFGITLRETILRYYQDHHRHGPHPA